MRRSNPEHIQKEDYNSIIAFGQKPVTKSIYLERYGCIDGQKYFTAFDYEPLKDFLICKKYKVKISDNAGNYLCNHVYGVGLNRIEKQKRNTKFIFVHIPNIKNLDDVNRLASVFNEYVECHLIDKLNITGRDML